MKPEQHNSVDLVVDGENDCAVQTVLNFLTVPEAKPNFNAELLLI